MSFLKTKECFQLFWNYRIKKCIHIDKVFDTQFDKYLLKKMIIINRLNIKFSSLNGWTYYL